MRGTIALTAVLLLAGISTADASPRYDAARRSARGILKQQQELQRRVRSLSPAERQRLADSLRGAEDSDGDGTPDIIENADGSSDACRYDSDGDGISDREDARTDDHNYNDPSGVKVEAKGPVTSFSINVLIVSGQSFVVNAETAFKGRNFSSASLVPGACVEVEGRRTDATTVVALKVKSEDHCGGED